LISESTESIVYHRAAMQCLAALITMQQQFCPLCGKQFGNQKNSL